MKRPRVLARRVNLMMDFILGVVSGKNVMNGENGCVNEVKEKKN